MEILTAGLFTAALYKALETLWEQSVKAAWKPGSEEIKAHFLSLAGKDQESRRRAAFARATEIARAKTMTMRTAPDLQQAKRILDLLDGKLDKRVADAFAQEAAKLMLFSANPDVPRLTEICNRALRFEALLAGETPPVAETAAVLSDYLTNLREALLDQEPYQDLRQREMLSTLRQIVVELRPLGYDDEATYRAQLAEMHRQLEFVGIPELKERRPITVEDIFIHLRAEREAEVPEFPEEVLARRMGKEAEELREFREMPRVVKERVDVDAALRGAKRLVVLGDPGAGKTTLLKYLAVICAEGRAEAELGLRADGTGSPLPIFIPLREFAAECAGRDQDYCLLDYLYTHAREHFLLNLQRGFFEEALEAGRCLVCLDGLDEVWAVGQRAMVSDAVKALAARFPRSRYLVTSRLVGYEEVPLDRRDFTHHTILPFEDEDIRQFVRKWYAVRERDHMQRKKKTDDLIATMEREPRIKALATNPLLLTIIALVHRIEAELPNERVKLYDKCITALVETWEEVKGLTLAEKQRPFYRYRRRLLERLAYELHTQAEKPGQLQMVKEGDLELLLTGFLMESRRLGLADDPDGTRDEARAFIHLARGRTGLLVERGEGVFGFPHLTFQEYLAACDIENRCIHRGVGAIWEEIEDRLHDPHWREVILLLLGSLNKYDEPPTLLVKRILKAGKRDKFERVLHRHLYLAARALADRVDVADDLHRQVVYEMLEIAHKAPGGEGLDASDGLSWLEQDSYAVDSLLVLAHDPQVATMVRLSAAWALEQLGRTEEAGEALLAVLRDPIVQHYLSRASLFEILRRLIRTEEKKVLDGLLALTRDPQVEVWLRSEATLALRFADGKVLDNLLALARDPQVAGEVRKSAAQALAALGYPEEAKNILLALAHDPQVEAEVRCDAAEVLVLISHAEERVLDDLLTMAHDPQMAPGLGAAIWILGELRQTGEKVLNSLLTLARDSQVIAEVRCKASWALGQLGRADEAAEALLALARGPQMDAGVRRFAASALGQLGRAEGAEVLLALVYDPQVEAEVRHAAASGLGQLGRADEAAEVLLALARDPQVEAEMRSDAAQALGQLGRSEQAAEVLLALASDPQVEADVRRKAAEALGQLGRTDEKVLDGLLVLASDQKVKPEVRSYAAQALGQLGCSEQAAEVLLALARDPQVAAWVRSDAAQALGQLGRSEQAAEVLLALASDPQVEADVRRKAAEALGQLGRTDEKVLHGLLALASDPQVEADVRSEAYEGLKRLVGRVVA